MAIAHVQTVNAAMDSDAGVGQDQPITWSGTGNCGILYMGAWISGGSPAITDVSGTVSGTWSAGAVLTLDSNRIEAFYYKPNITAGAETINVATGGATLGAGRILLMEFSGVSTTSPLEDSQQNNASPSSTSHTLTLTPTTPNSLCVYGLHTLGDTTLSGDLTQRSEVETFMACHVMTTLGTGATTGTWTIGTALGAHKIGITLKPQGLANVKTVNGLSLASVKTVNGLEIASVKSVNGLA